MILDFLQNLIFCLVFVRTPSVCGRRTGVPMNGLVSTQDQQPAPL